MPRATLPVLVCRAGGGRGGYNFTPLPSWTEPFYSARNAEALHARGSHDTTKVLWKITCGCYLYKSRHAVACNIARWEGKGQPTCFLCPWHDDWRKGVSQYGYRAYAVMCSLLGDRRRQGRPSGTIAWEAHAVKGLPPYDMYVIGPELLIEVDGEGHSSKPMHGHSVRAQKAVDARKDAGARAAGVELVRLTPDNEGEWRDILEQAVEAAWARR